MPLIEPERISYLLKVIDISTFSWKPSGQELVQLFQRHDNKKLVSKLLDAGECFVAATELEQKFPGPAILLYTAAVEVLGKSPDIELRKQIEKANELFRKVGIEKDENVKATADAARDKARFQRTRRFLRAEFEADLRQANYSVVCDEIATRIVDVGNEVRHQSQVRGKDYFCPGLFVSEGKLIRPEREQCEMLKGKADHRTSKKLKKLMGFEMPAELEVLKGPKISNGPIMNIISFPMIVKPFQELIKPARIGSANAITKHVEDLKCGKSKS